MGELACEADEAPGELEHAGRVQCHTFEVPVATHSTDEAQCMALVRIALCERHAENVETVGLRVKNLIGLPPPPARR